MLLIVNNSSTISQATIKSDLETDGILLSGNVDNVLIYELMHKTDIVAYLNKSIPYNFTVCDNKNCEVYALRDV